MPMFEVIRSDEFIKWLLKLRDKTAALRIAARIRNAELGHLGDFKYLRDGVNEMRIHVGAGYRVYFTRHNDAIIVLLCGGNKSSQAVDIQRAIELAKRWQE